MPYKSYSLQDYSLKTQRGLQDNSERETAVVISDLSMLVAVSIENIAGAMIFGVSTCYRYCL